MSECESLFATKVALETLFGVNLGDLERKDQKNHARKEIEGVWTTADGRRSFAVEHTSVDLFEGQRELAFLFQPIRDSLRSKLVMTNPDARVYVSVTTEFLSKVSRSVFKSTEDLIATKINEAMERTEPGQTTILELVEVRSKVYVKLVPYQRAGTGFLVLALALTPELMTGRLDRFAKAINDKCPKLNQYRLDGCQTVLVLEDVDFFHSDFDNFRAMFGQLKYESDFLPDVILYVERNSDSIAGICQMKIDDRWFAYSETANLYQGRTS